MLYRDAGPCGHLRGARVGSLPVPGQQLVQLMALGSPGDDALEHVGQVGLRIEIVELCGVNERCQDRPALGATLAAAEQ
jgi:hypothetical protein